MKAQLVLVALTLQGVTALELVGSRKHNTTRRFRNNEQRQAYIDEQNAKPIVGKCDHTDQVCYYSRLFLSLDNPNYLSRPTILEMFMHRLCEEGPIRCH
ncbi:hypothetical protein ACCO45_002747 [Purpureocillium lilacinum]|uniref:Uncharacterized protein n=1 Tax=Purpureocillium lilacinum TaxID=33203 RepID=A0ACC4DZB8_PURLI